MLNNNDIRSELEKNPKIDNSRIDVLIDFYNTMIQGVDTPTSNDKNNK